eukprot:m.131918 g.131918  ORF g.131918 m.131918 type:complete len:288 (+) comp52371_c0_seq1:1009-1872(+)
MSAAGEQTKWRPVAALTSGLIQSAMFSPWDRALFLSLKHSRPFLALPNWSHPFQGLRQAITQRTLSAGLYYILQDEMVSIFQPVRERNPMLSEFLVGLTAGGMNGAILTPLVVIKYHGWGTSDARTLFSVAARQIFSEGGLLAFFKGARATVCRDSAFGLTYEITRSFIKQQAGVTPLSEGGSKLENFACDALGASLGTIMSSPLNYSRNLILATPHSERAPTIRDCLQRLLREMRAQPSQLAYLESRLQLGWGTARVAFSMGVGQFIYQQVKSFCEDQTRTGWKFS